MYYPSLYENAECIGTCVMAFPFSGRRRCNQHSQGNDKRELCQCSPIRCSVTPNPFWVRVGFGIQAQDLIGCQAHGIDTFYYCHIIPIESQISQASIYRIIYQAIYSLTIALDIDSILLIYFTYIYFTTLHLYCTVYIYIFFSCTCF